MSIDTPFTDKISNELTAQLPAIEFPGEIRVIEHERQIAAAESLGEALLLLDAPTLYEAGADRFCCCVAAVCAPFDLRLERILRRDGLSREAALLRLSAQNDDAFYRERADIVLYNDGTKEEFLQKADGLIDALIRRFTPPATK